MRRYIYIALFNLSFGLSIFSQTIPIPYFCGFEDSTEVSKWQLNQPATNTYKENWIVGNGARNEGRSGLYITNDGYSAQYGVASNMVIAYRAFSVPQRIPYDISFDWKSTGKKGTSDLYVVLLPQGSIPPNSNPTSANIPNIVKQFSVGQLNNSSQWQSFSFNQTLRANENYHLMFVWVNNNTDTTLVNPIGACIDNLQITSTFCPKPTTLNISTSCDTTWIDWKGTSTSYQVQYKSRNDLKWKGLGTFNNNNNNNKAFVTNLAEGLYDFRVRGICPSDTSAYLTKNSVIVFCPEKHCINYIALTDTSFVNAYTGSAANPYLVEEIVDYGPENKMSRHTVNWTSNEFDPRTGNKLRLIPEDEFVSVRLGNWNSGNQGESLIYSYVVDENSSLLLLKYAVVLEDPAHGKEAQPRFTLEILDENDDLIDPTCGVAEFYADRNMSGWHLAANNVTWKDWTTIGLNLTDYIGKKLKIRLATGDCTAGAHFGYAYFTLNCASATIKTNSCGDSPLISVSGPDGFEYKWYNPLYPDSVWHTKDINIAPSDTSTYYCDVRYKNDTTCYFTLSTAVFPRFPIADFEYTYSAKNCRNILRFKNKSHIMTRFDGNEVHTSQPCESYYWDFGNDDYSTYENPEYVCSNDGDTINVKLYAYLSNGQCSNDTTIQIIVPRIGETTDTVYHDICQGEFYRFGKYYLMESGVFSDTLQSKRTGCDSITVLKLTVHPQYDIPAVVDTICFGEKYTWNGKDYTTTTKKELWLLSKYGCDSIVTLDLTVLNEILFDVKITDVGDEPFTGKIEILNAPNEYAYSLNGVMEAPLTELSGGDYELILYNRHGCASIPKNIYVNQDCLEVDLLNDSINTVCIDDNYVEFEYQIHKGYLEAIDVIFSDDAIKLGFENIHISDPTASTIQIPIPKNIRPNEYGINIVFVDHICQKNIEIPISIEIKYTSFIVSQKWNDVLAVMNSSYNGGYEFANFQWYKNGEPLTGEIGSYLYIKDGYLDFSSHYSVLLTRADDGKSFFTCDIIPVMKEGDISLYPTIVQANSPVMLSTTQPVDVSIYNSMGIKQKSQTFNAGSNQALYISNNPGYYIVNILPEEGTVRSYRLIVK